MGELKKLDKPEKGEKTEKASKAAPAKEPAKKPAASRLNVEGAQKFFRGVGSELKKVHWPTRQEVTTYTGVVVAAVVIVGFLIFLVDEAIGLALAPLYK